MTLTSTIQNAVGTRPDHATWKPLSNADPPDDTACFQQAADKLGIQITIGYPVPCSAGAGLAASFGMRGIYILRSQADREHELMDEYWNQHRELRS